jgi:hypothetical protein
MKPLKYCNESLKQFCLENGVELCRDYSNDLVRRETSIEGKCTTDGCDNIFNKRFVELYLKKSVYCKTCMSKIKPRRYSYDCLQQFCLENTVELCKDYSNEIVNANTKIEGKCTTKQCNKIFIKKFVAFLDNTKCNICVKIEKYKNVKQTFMEKYSGHPSQNKLVQEKTKLTNLKKYGVEYCWQNETVKNKVKNTMIERYGVENPNQCDTIRNKTKLTNLKKYGVEYPSQYQTFKDKSKQTCLINYGVEHNSQNTEIKFKKENTCLKNYGVTNPTLNPEIAQKASNNSYQTKFYTLPSGNIIKYQGYEHFALDELLKTVSEEHILNSKIDVPNIWYNDLIGNKHKHYVDIFIPSQNLCIEVKSEWTIKIPNSNVFLKQAAAKELGYKYEIWVYNKKGIKTNCYQ